MIICPFANHLVGSYRLWQLVWKAWTEYVVLSKEKKRRNEIARRLGGCSYARTSDCMLVA